jgi:hypothetical protein
MPKKTANFGFYLHWIYTGVRRFNLSDSGSPVVQSSDSSRRITGFKYETELRDLSKPDATYLGSNPPTSERSETLPPVLWALQGVLDKIRARWDRPTVLLTLDAKRRLTVPSSLAPSHPGDHFEAEFHPEDDTLVFRRIAPKGDWMAVMKECPVPMDDLPARRRALPRRRKL